MTLERRVGLLCGPPSRGKPAGKAPRFWIMPTSGSRRSGGGGRLSSGRPAASSLGENGGLAVSCFASTGGTSASALKELEVDISTVVLYGSPFQTIAHA